MSSDYIAYRDGLWTPTFSVEDEDYTLRIPVEKGQRIRFDPCVNGALDLSDDACVAEARLIENYRQEAETDE